MAAVLSSVAGAPVGEEGRALTPEDTGQVRKTEDASSSILPTSASDAVFSRTLHDDKVWTDGNGRVSMGVALSYDNKKFYAEMLTVTDFRLRNKRHPDKFWTSTRPTITSTWMTLMTNGLGSEEHKLAAI